MGKHGTFSLIAWLSMAGCSGPVAKREPKKQVVPRIVHFYASPPSIAKGERALLCYSVEDTQWVRLDPPVERLTPSFSRCITVDPAVTTTYTLSVPGQNKDARIEVGPPRKKADHAPKLIRFFMGDPGVVRAGERVTLCYGVEKAQSVRLDPDGTALPAVAQHCLTRTIAAPTTFRLKVDGADGTHESMTLSVKTKE